MWYSLTKGFIAAGVPNRDERENMISKRTKIIIGIMLIALGGFMFARETRIYSWSFYRRASSVPAILVILLMASAILYIALRDKRIIYIMIALAAGLLVSLIMGMRMYFSGSLLNLALILLPICAGAGVLAGVFINDNDE
jgi:hypothetical protein